MGSEFWPYSYLRHVRSSLSLPACWKCPFLLRLTDSFFPFFLVPHPFCFFIHNFPLFLYYYYFEFSSSSFIPKLEAGRGIWDSTCTVAPIFTDLSFLCLYLIWSFLSYAFYYFWSVMNCMSPRLFSHSTTHLLICSRGKQSTIMKRRKKREPGLKRSLGKRSRATSGTALVHWR